MNNSVTFISWPFGRWFAYLLIGVILTLIEIRFVKDPKDKVYAVDVETFHEVDGSLVPTSEKVWIDAKAYAKLRSGSWLTTSFLVIALDLVFILVITKWRGTRRKGFILHNCQHSYYTS